MKYTLITTLALSLALPAQAMDDNTVEEEDGFVIVQQDHSLLTRCKKMQIELTVHKAKVNERLACNIPQLFDFDNTHSDFDKKTYVFLAEKELTGSKQDNESDLKKLKDIEDIYALEQKGTIEIGGDGTKQLEQWYKDLYVNCQKPIDTEIDALLLGDTPISHKKLEELILKRVS